MMSSKPYKTLQLQVIENTRSKRSTIQSSKRNGLGTEVAKYEN